MDLYRIVKLGAVTLQTIAALGCIVFGYLLASSAYAAMGGSGAPPSPAEHASMLQSLTVGVGVVLFGVIGLTLAGYTFKRLKTPQA